MPNDKNRKKFKPHKDKPSSSKSEELSNKYRDRAKERRDGQVKDFELDPEDLKYSDVEENRLISEDERRQQQIEESKFLGGDVKHTHLVKGLDFALLQKIKNELKTRNEDLRDSEDESESEDEAVLEAMKRAHLLSDNKKIPKEERCKTRLAQNIVDVLNEKLPEKNHLFLPDRMSYIMPIDLDSFEPPITIIRSKVDVSSTEESSTNDIIIDQLIQKLSRNYQHKLTKRKRPKDPETS